MGIPDSSLQDLIEKITSWVSRGGSDIQYSSTDCHMPDNSRMCWECNRNFTEMSVKYYCCQRCGRWLCGKCNENFDCLLINESEVDNMEKTGFRGTIKCCKFCCEVSMSGDVQRKYFDKVHPSASPLESPRESPEPPSPSCCGENDRVSSSISSESTHGAHLDCYRHAKDDGCSHARIDRSMTSLGVHPAPVTTRRSPARSDEDEAVDDTGNDTGRHAFSPSSECWNNNSDVDSNSISARHEFDSCKSMSSSPSESPSRIGYTTSSFVNSVQQRGDASPTSKNHGTVGQETLAVLRKPEFDTKGTNNTDDCSDDLITLPNESEKSKRPLNFENNGLIWFPPPPDDGNEDADSNFFSYADADDDDEMGDSGIQFSSSSLSYAFPAKEKNTDGNKEPLKAVIEGHFRALVSQLLLGEGIKVGKENSGDQDWLDIVATLACQAANFVKPDTSKGGSMDPVDYVKVKCIATGNPRESTLVKGIVCTKNIKHKRMTSQYKNPRLLLLGGALEYHKVPNELSSFDTLLQQEKDHLKTIISKIEAHRTNVLLVEKTVSSHAQEYLLAKEISLVLNVKKPLLERIARCTGSSITPSIDHVSAARLGHCELFRLERVVEEHENNNQFNRKPTKTLMFFEGCPRRLGCTVLLKGGPREELRKVKHVVQYAVFAAYHLSLETSFLADEGATLPKLSMKSSAPMPERVVMDDASLETSNSLVPTKYELEVNVNEEGKLFGRSPNPESSESVSDHLAGWHGFESLGGTSSTQVDNLVSDAGCNSLAAGSASHPSYLNKDNIVGGQTLIWSSGKDSMPENLGQEEVEYSDIKESVRSEGIDENGVSSEYLSATDSHQSILVYFSSHCVSKGTVCEKSQLLRIKFYGSCDKPLGKYLREDLFDETYSCKSCPEPAESHILCFTHQQGNLTINVRRLPSIKLPGEKEGKIWMWHRCLRCAHVDGVPPATRRVVMSNAAWGLSFGKFLELSFSNHATANRVATCGHSLQRDCLRFYGCGSMVAFFRYSPINVHSVSLPPSVLEFNGRSQQEWIRKEAAEVLRKTGALYTEISDILECMEDRSASLHLGTGDSYVHDLRSHVIQLKEVLEKEKSDYSNLLQTAVLMGPETGQMGADILELNRMRRTLLISSHIWDHRLNSLDSLLKRQSVPKVKLEDGSISEMKDSGVDLSSKNDGHGSGFEQNGVQPSTLQVSSNHALGEVDESDPLFESCTKEELMLTMHHCYMEEEIHSDGEIIMNKTLSLASHDSNLSDRIDSAWTGSDQLSCDKSQTEGLQSGSVRQVDEGDNPTFRRLMSPMRVHSFDSALGLQDRIRRGLDPSSLHLSALRSFHALGDYRNMLKDPVSNMKTQYQVLPWEAQKLNLLLSSTLSFISTASQIVEGVRLLLPQSGHSERVIAVYDDEPTSIISYALSSKEHEDWVSDKLNLQSWNSHDRSKEDFVGSRFTSQQSLMSLDLDFVNSVSHASEDASSSFSSLFTEPKRSPHFRISFGDDSSSAGGSVKFSVTCYFAKQFDSLRKQCCPTEADFLRSLSRCRRWSAQGGKSNVFFAKTLDERFIIKQVTKTELESFEEFALQYFKYMTESLSSGSPTCLAKILGIYQVLVKYPKGGKETKMDLMVMENLFYKRNLSRVYDLKGSVRSRYNPDTTGTNKVLLDVNLLETLRTKPIFLGSRAKRKLERAVWNDTSFLASVDVMDYSLLVGVDEERKELVLGIIDFMRQYTWDKHLETWVKASGILGGPKNALPTVISPKQYKKRFRKAMTTYFLTLPDHWSS